VKPVKALTSEPRRLRRAAAAGSFLLMIIIIIVLMIFSCRVDHTQDQEHE
jgi:preprotein translocase subunit YajC